MQAASIRHHATSTVHRVAQNHYLCPDQPITEILPYNLEDQNLYRGNVPQPTDWLRAWDACHHASSFQKAQQHYETEDFAHGRQCTVSRKSFSDR